MPFNFVGEPAEAEFRVSFEAEVVRAIGKKRKVKADVIYHPVLAECAKLVDNVIWKEVLLRGARGKFRNGFNMRGTSLFVPASASMNSSVDVPTDPVLALPVVLDFFRRYDNINVGVDVEPTATVAKKRRVVRTNEAELAVNMTHRAHFRMHKVQTYIRDLELDERLTQTESRELRCLVGLATRLQFVATKDLVLSAHEDISYIDGLDFSETTRRFSIAKENILVALKKKKNTSRSVTRKQISAEEVVEGLKKSLRLAAPKHAVALPGDDDIPISAIFTHVEM